MSKLPVAIITGTNSGLGLALTVAMSKTHKVYAGMRSLSKSGDLEAAVEKNGTKANVFVTEIDVNSDESVNKCVEAVISKENQLDVMFCNAGYAVVGSVEMIEMKSLQEQMNTNFFGVIRCQKACLPQMCKQKSGHILVTSSVGGVFGQPFNDVYCASKFAVEGMFEAQAPLFRTFGVYTTSIQPGGIKTAFAANIQRPTNVPDEYKAAMMKTFGAFEQTDAKEATVDGITIACAANRQTAEEIADIIVQKAILVKNPPAKLQVNDKIQSVFDASLTDPSGEKLAALVSATFLKGISQPNALL